MTDQPVPPPSSELRPPIDFRCSRPDFIIKAMPSGIVFRVNKAKMYHGSIVFQDMFGMCDCPPADEGDLTEKSDPESEENIPADQSMEIHEQPEIFALFLTLLHGEQPKEQEKPTLVLEQASEDDERDGGPTELPDVPAVSCTSLPPLIPLPLLRPLWDLLDKYDVTSNYESILQSHLKQHTAASPREVYCFAHQLDLTLIASYASSFLLARPLHTYTHEEVAKYFPSLKAYHRLTLLHGYRQDRLREVTLKEDLFPHGYGLCPKHGKEADKAWKQRREDLALKILPSTDVVRHMELIKSEAPFKSCQACGKACDIATDMLKYKVAKVPWAFDRVPGAL